MQSELRILVRKNLGLACPQRMRHLQPVRGVGRAKLAGLDEEGEKCGDKQQQRQRTREDGTEH